MKLLLLLTIIFSTAAYGMHEGSTHSHQGVPAATAPLVDINVKANEVLLEVHGVVCSFCSKGIQKKLSKLSFVDTSKFITGSQVEIENQRVTIAIKPGEKADIEMIYDSVRSGGYEPIAAYLLKNNVIVKFNAEGKQCTSDTVSC